MTYTDTTHAYNRAFEALGASQDMQLEAEAWLYANNLPLYPNSSPVANIAISINRYYPGGTPAFVDQSETISDAELEAWIEHSETYRPWIEDGIDNVYSWATVGA